MEEVQACTHARQLLSAEKSLFIYDHLEGKAREEIWYRSKVERENSDTSLDILQETISMYEVTCL